MASRAVCDSEDMMGEIIQYVTADNNKLEREVDVLREKLRITSEHLDNYMKLLEQSEMRHEALYSCLETILADTSRDVAGNVIEVMEGMKRTDHFIEDIDNIIHYYKTEQIFNDIWDVDGITSWFT